MVFRGCQRRDGWQILLTVLFSWSAIQRRSVGGNARLIFWVCAVFLVAAPFLLWLNCRLSRHRVFVNIHKVVGGATLPSREPLSTAPDAVVVGVPVGSGDDETFPAVGEP